MKDGLVVMAAMLGSFAVTFFGVLWVERGPTAPPPVFHPANDLLLSRAAGLVWEKGKNNE